MAAPIVEFRVLNNDGSVRCPLPDVETWTLSPVANDAGSLQFTYPTYGVNWSVLQECISFDKDIFIQVLFDGVVQLSLQACVRDIEGDDIAEGSVWTYTCDLALGRLSEAVIEPQGGMPAQGDDTITVENESHYYSCTAGTIVSTMMAEAHVRGALSDITYASFSGTLDSAGNSWSKIITLKMTPGTDYLKIMQSLVEAGMCEVVMVGKDLRIYELDHVGTDRTLTSPPIVFRAGQNLSDSPRKHTVRSSATAVLVAGAAGVYQWSSDAVAQSRRGRRIEQGSSQGQISDPTTLLAYSQTFLSGVVSGRMEKTHGLTLVDGPVPVRDFDVHDWCWSDLGVGLERLRVAQWTLSSDAAGALVGSVVLNDLIAERDAAIALRLQGIQGGTTISGTSNARPVPETLIDGVAPAAPSGLTVSSIAYTTDENVTLASVTAQWDAVTFNSDSTAMTDLGHYDVYWRYTDSSMNSLPLAFSWQLAGSGTDVFVTWNAVRPGVVIDVEVYATDTAGNRSAVSAVVQHTTATDTTAPPVPSTPLLTAMISSIRIEWNGKGSANEVMPNDFKYVEIHVSTVNNFTPSTSTLYDTIGSAAAIAYTKGVYGTTYFVRFVGVDTSGNKSAASATASAAPRQILNPDIANLSIGNAQINDLDVGKVTSGILTATITLSGQIATASSGARFGMSSAEFFAFNSGGTKTVSITNAGAVSVQGEIKTGTSGARIVLNPGGTAPTEMRFYPASATLGKYISLFTADVPGSTGYSLAYYKGDRFTGNPGEACLRMWYYEACLGWFDTTSDILSNAESVVYAREYSSGMNGSRTLFVAHGLRDSPWHEFAWTNDSGTQSVGLGRFFKDSLDAFIVSCPAKGSALCFQGNWLFAVSAGNTNTHIGLTAATLTQDSGVQTKTNIEDLSFDPLVVLEGAPCKQWEYRADHEPRPQPAPLRRHEYDRHREGPAVLREYPIELEPLPDHMKRVRKHFGPMAEDLPEGVRVYGPTSATRPLLDHGSFMGLQWAILRRFNETIKGLVSDVEKLKGKK